jgi:Secretion system C-terminal sorting domain
MKGPFRAASTGLILMLAYVCAAPAFGQSGGFSYQPVVFYYGCDHSAATVPDSASDSALTVASFYVYHLIAQDSLTRQIVLVGNETADTVAADSGQDVFTSPPDSLTQPGERTEYWLASKVTGSEGNYRMTVYLEDSFTETVFDSGTALFSNPSPAEIRNACGSAVGQILPIVTRIEDHQRELRANDPSLSIDPQIAITLSKYHFNVNEAASVTVKLTDYDGVPLPNVDVALSVQGSGDGSFTSDNVITGSDGTATATFNAGDVDAVEELSATVSGLPLVTHTTTQVSSAADVIVGAGTGDIYWQCKFKFKALIINLDNGASYGKSSWGSNTGTLVEEETMNGTMLCDVSEATNDALSFNPPCIDFQNVPSESVEGNFQESYEYESVSYSLTQKGTCFGYGSETRTENGPAIFPPDGTSLVQASADTGLYTAAFDTSCFYFPNYSGSYKDVTRQFAAGTCGYYNTRDTVTSTTAAGEPGIEMFPGTKGGVISLDSARCEYRYSFSRDTSWSQYQIGLGTSGVSVSYSSGLRDTVVQFDAIFRPFSTPLTGITGNKSLLPRTYSLSQNYPNPFNPTTAINYQLPAMSDVTLKVYDVLGREVETLENGEQSAGRYEVKFDGSRLASGVYFYRLTAKSDNGRGFVSTKKLMLVK